MPANLTPEYHRAEARFRAARTTEEKIEALEEMLRVMPKHKGTDHLQADIKARIAKLRKQPAKKGARAGFSHMIPREGAGQIVLVGPPNTGKSSLVARLTHARPEVADYPFTTREALPGMMPFEDITFQLVDMPPLSAEHVEHWVFDLVRRADLLWIVVDGLDPFDEIERTQGLLDQRNIRIHPPAMPPPADDWSLRYQKKALIVVTGLDRPGVSDGIGVLCELLEGRWPVVPVSTVTGAGLEELKRRTFEAFGIIRIYTKQPGKPADRHTPFTLPRGATVGELAERIHKEILAHMKFARIWGTGVFDGQTVQRDHVLAEGDVVEIHA